MEFYDILSDILEEDVNENTVLRELEAFDSLSILSIIAMVDKQYKVMLTAKDIQNTVTAGDLLAYINSRK